MSASAGVSEALARQLAALLLPGDAAASPAQLAARLRAVAASLEAPPAAPAAAAAAAPPPSATRAQADAASPAHGDAACEGSGSDGEGDGQAGSRKRRVRKPFDITRYEHRLVAMELFYAGWNYHGFATQGTGADAAETVETRLWAALRTTRLIGADATWAQCLYSRCGRTDRGVSAMRQVVALRVRCAGAADAPPSAELDYVALLNRQLPDDIRVLSWRPAPEGFSARFSARWRQYKYFFWDDGLDLVAMRDAASRLVGEHDFRNLCKMDVANVRNFVRRIHFFTLAAEDADSAHIPPADAAALSRADAAAAAPQPPLRRNIGRLMSLNVRGTAFLYHQVRCMAAVLFMVGRGLEQPAIVDALLDVAAHPRKPMYDMAADEPLMFYACGYEDGTLGDAALHEAKSKAQLVTHLRTEARRAAVRAAVLREALDAVVSGGDADAASSSWSQRKHVPLLSRRREPSYEEQLARYKGKEAAKDAAAAMAVDEAE